MKDFTTVTGTKEYGPVEMSLRQHIIDTIKDVYTQNGFSLIKTPILESLDLLCHGDKGDNSKLMFKTIKRRDKLVLDKPNLNEEDIVEEGLRYDLTVPLCRFYCNNKNDLTIPFKSIQIDESFRAEKPQKGRYRQFTQCDVDIIGEPSGIAEVELLVTAIDAYKAVGIPTNVEIAINNRKLLSAVIKHFGFEDEAINNINISLDKLDKIGEEGVVDELIKQGLHEESVKSLVRAIAQIKSQGMEKVKALNIDASLIEELQVVIDGVKALRPEANIHFDITVVRGQGYYTGTIYEVFAKDLGYRSALGGGGRYDNMVGEFSGVNTPAVGFSIGLESVMVILNENNVKQANNKLALIYSDTDMVTVLKIKDELKATYQVAIFPRQKNFRAQLERLSLNGFDRIAKMENGQLDDIKNI